MSFSGLKTLRWLEVCASVCVCVCVSAREPGGRARAPSASVVENKGEHINRTGHQTLQPLWSMRKPECR
jgi:hypothetical protein